MKYAHVRNIEKYHPGYKDRTLQWMKLYFNMVHGDPEFEMIESEIDKWRFVAFVCLELQAKNPIPLNDKYLTRKGFNIIDRPILLTLQVLHNFIEVIQNHVAQNKNKSKSKSNIKKNKNKIKTLGQIDTTLFDRFWVEYPNKKGKITAREKWKKKKLNDKFDQIMSKLLDYKKTEKWQNIEFVPHPSTWLNQERWEDELSKQEMKTISDYRQVEKGQAVGEWVTYCSKCGNTLFYPKKEDVLRGGSACCGADLQPEPKKPEIQTKKTYVYSCYDHPAQQKEGTMMDKFTCSVCGERLELDLTLSKGG